MNEIELIQKQDEFLTLKNNIQTAINESKGIIVLVQDQVDKCGFYIKNFRQLLKKIEDYRKRIVSPLNDELKSINTFFKNLQIDIELEEKRLNKEVSNFMEEKRREQEEQRKREQKELIESIIDDAILFDDESILDVIPKIEFKQIGLGNISDNVTSARKKEWRLIDINKVPRQYLMLDEKLINKARRESDFEDISPIGGIEYFYTENIRTK